MSDVTPSFIARLSLAFRLFLRVLSDDRFAADALRQHTERSGSAAPRGLRETRSDAALQLLRLLQQNGRLVDFLQEDITQYADAQIGATVRAVHEGCRATLREHFTISPIQEQPEGTRITLAPGYDATAVQPTGNVLGEPPFSGILVHRGWRVSEARLPKLTAGHDPRVLAPAEVEL